VTSTVEPAGTSSSDSPVLTASSTGRDGLMSDQPSSEDPHDRRKAEGLPPGSDTKGDPTSRLRGNDREAAPYEEAPAEGHLAPDADNPPP
jgi:hypothetical protein